jgi:hypothetical protein
MHPIGGITLTRQDKPAVAGTLEAWREGRDSRSAPLEIFLGLRGVLR